MGNLQKADLKKNILYIILALLIVFVLLTVAVAPMILASISGTSKQNSTDNYVDMYYLATHPEEFRGESVTTIGIVRHHSLSPMFEDFQLACQSEEKVGPDNRFILVVTRPAGLTNPNYGSLVELSGKWESTDLEDGYYYLNATKLSTIEAMPNSTFSEKDFPLGIDLSKTNYNVGEQIAFNATITNKSGKDVNMLSNGHQPWAFFHNINDNRTFGETTEGFLQTFQANQKITRAYQFEANEPGTYIIFVHYQIRVNEIWLEDEINMTLSLNS
jgi:hypothetical protein